MAKWRLTHLRKTRRVLEMNNNNNSVPRHADKAGSVGPAMSDTKPDLFFPADSDTDDDEIRFSGQPLQQPSSRTQAAASAPDVKKEALFLPVEDEGDIVMTGESSPGPSRPPSSASSTSKRQRPSSQRDSSVRADFTRGYLGEFVCEGWSLSKGKGYCSPGSRIVFERPKATKAPQADTTSSSSGPTRLVNGKVVPGKGKVGGRQMSLTSMMSKKAAPPVAKKPAAKKVDQIVRFKNDRGFGGLVVSSADVQKVWFCIMVANVPVGRLSVNEAGFLVSLLDTGVSEYAGRVPLISVELGGHVIDCPPVLSTGATILLNVKVYLSRSGFEKMEKKDRKEGGPFWLEQQETEEEEAMRVRKESLGRLFGGCFVCYL